MGTHNESSIELPVIPFWAHSVSIRVLSKTDELACLCHPSTKIGDPRPLKLEAGMGDLPMIGE